MNALTLNTRKVLFLRPNKGICIFMALVLAAAIVWQQFSLNSFNNFSIFSASFGHLRQHTNLYLFYPGQYDDVFLYNPSLAVFFAPFSLLPTWLGMWVWTTSSLLLYLYAVNRLPLAPAAKLFILMLSLPDSINSLQHMQVNHINLALMLLTPIMLGNKRFYLAALLTAVLFYVKVYPAAIGLCFVFYPNKSKYLLGCIFWSIVLFLLPLLFVSFSELLQQYQNWFASLAADKTVEECATSLSLISINYQWLKNPLPPALIQLAGLSIMLLPLVLKRKLYGGIIFQQNFLAALLLFIIVFNHAAESATYLVAVTGVCLWFINSAKTIADKLLLGVVLIFTVLAVTDLFPTTLKSGFIQPYSIRAVPCILVWMKIIADLLTLKNTHETRSTL